LFSFIGKKQLLFGLVLALGFVCRRHRFRVLFSRYIAAFFLVDRSFSYTSNSQLLTPANSFFLLIPPFCDSGRTVWLFVSVCNKSPNLMQMICTSVATD